MTERLSIHTDLSCFLLQMFIAINFYLELLLLPPNSFDMSYFHFFRSFCFAFSFDFFFDYWLFSCILLNICEFSSFLLIIDF